MSGVELLGSVLQELDSRHSALALFADELVQARLIRSAGELVKGRWVEQSRDPSVFINIIVPQPLSDGENQVFAEDGAYSKDYRKTWTAEKLSSGKGRDNADLIGWHDGVYMVVDVDDRNYQEGFYRVIMRRMPDND